MDTGAGDRPQLYVYCPNLDWNKMKEREVMGVWYNHIIRAPLRQVWRKARLSKMELPAD
jgi:hypothetical protein